MRLISSFTTKRIECGKSWTIVGRNSLLLILHGCDRTLNNKIPKAIIYDGLLKMSVLNEQRCNITN